jgi:cytochrome c5
MARRQVILLMVGIAAAGIVLITARAHVPEAASVPPSADPGETVGDPGPMMEGPYGMMPMRGMMHRMIPDLVPPGVAPESLPDPESHGAKLMVLYCRQCHNLPSPSMHSAAEWPAVAQRMFYRIEGMGGMMGIQSPSEEDRTAIVDYLEAHAMQAVPEASIPGAGSPGASLYKEFCTQCHALPDPGSHTRGEWPAIVDKMQATMKVMNKKSLTADQKKQILGYLDKNAGTS